MPKIEQIGPDSLYDMNMNNQKKRPVFVAHSYTTAWHRHRQSLSICMSHTGINSKLM